MISSLGTTLAGLKLDRCSCQYTKCFALNPWYPWIEVDIRLIGVSLSEPQTDEMYADLFYIIICICRTAYHIFLFDPMKMVAVHEQWTIYCRMLHMVW